MLSLRFIGEESGSVFEARKSALRRYHTPFCSRLWRPSREIQSSFDGVLGYERLVVGGGQFVELAIRATHHQPSAVVTLLFLLGVRKLFSR